MQMNVTTKLVLALGFAAIVPAVYGESHDQTCQITSYFSDAAMKTQVGSESTCPGMLRHRGHMTGFAYTEVVEQPDPLADPGGLPCEWPRECAQPDPLSNPASLPCEWQCTDSGKTREKAH